MILLYRELRKSNIRIISLVQWKRYELPLWFWLRESFLVVEIKKTEEIKEQKERRWDGKYKYEKGKIEPSKYHIEKIGSGCGGDEVDKWNP